MKERWRRRQNKVSELKGGNAKMMKPFNRMVAVGIAVVAGCIAVQPARSANAADGKAVYSRKCQTCHGPDGNGNPGMAAALKVKFKPLCSDEIQKMPDAAIKKVITEGKGRMKPSQGLSDADVGDVIAFIRTLKK